METEHRPMVVGGKEQVERGCVVTIRGEALGMPDDGRVL